MANLDDALTEVEERRLRSETRADTQGQCRFSGLIDRAASLLGEAAFPSAATSKGAVVFNQNAASDRMIMVQSGWLSGAVGGPMGDQVRVARFLARALGGEIGFLTGAPRTATIVAEAPTTIPTIDRAGLDRLAAPDPALAQAIFQESAVLLAKRLAGTAR